MNKRKADNNVTVLMMATSPAHPGLLNSTDSLKLQAYQDLGMQAYQDLGKDGSCQFGYRVLGLGEAWGGWRHRMRKYRDAAADIAQHDASTLVVCMDSYDAVCMRPGDDLLEAFRSFQKPLLLSLEKACIGNCVPISDWWNSHGGSYLTALPKGRLPEDRYVNGGLLMGYAWAIRDLYDWMLKTDETDDQRGLGRYALTHRDQWAPDIHGRIFKNKLYGDTLTDADFKGNGVYFAHFPGLAWNGITSYEQTIRTVLKRPSNVVCTNMGTPAQFAAKIVALVLTIVLFIVAIVFIARSFQPAVAADAAAAAAAAAVDAAAPASVATHAARVE